MPIKSKAACTLPSSPQEPWSARKTRSAMAHSSSTPGPKRLGLVPFRLLRTSCKSGAWRLTFLPAWSTGAPNRPASSGPADSTPKYMSTSAA